MKELDLLLSGLDLRNKAIEAPSIFQKVLARLGGLFRWKSAQIEYKVSPDGTQSFVPRIDFDGTGNPKSSQSAEVPIEHCLQLLNEALREAGITIWIAIDRLDEAFHGFPEVEIPALRALFRSYLDLNDLSNLKLKLFVRRDLFRRITAGGFVNLTDVNARKFEIIWDDADLLNLICRRIVSNNDFASQAQLERSSNETIFDFMFPEQVDFGKRKPKTWNWILRRIRDGNDVLPTPVPRASSLPKRSCRTRPRCATFWLRHPMSGSGSARSATALASRSRPSRWRGRSTRSRAMPRPSIRRRLRWGCWAWPSSCRCSP